METWKKVLVAGNWSPWPVAKEHNWVTKFRGGRHRTVAIDWSGHMKSRRAVTRLQIFFIIFSCGRRVQCDCEIHRVLGIIHIDGTGYLVDNKSHFLDTPIKKKKVGLVSSILEAESNLWFGNLPADVSNMLYITGSVSASLECSFHCCTSVSTWLYVTRGSI